MEDAGGWYLAALPDGPIMALSASAVDVVASIEDGDSAEQVVSRIASLFEVSVNDIRADVQRVIDTLVASGVLEELP